MIAQRSFCLAVVIAQLLHILGKISEKVVKFSTFREVLKPRQDLGWGLGLDRGCYHASLIRSRIAKVSLCFLWLVCNKDTNKKTAIGESKKKKLLIYQDCKERSSRGCMGAKLRATTRKIINHVSNFQGKPPIPEI